MSTINFNTIKHGAVRVGIRMLLMLDGYLTKARDERDEHKRAYETACALNTRLHEGLAKAEALCKHAPSSYVELEQRLKEAQSESNSYRIAYNWRREESARQEERIATQAKTIRTLNDQLQVAHAANAELDKSLTAAIAERDALQQPAQDRFTVLSPNLGGGYRFRPIENILRAPDNHIVIYIGQ